MYLEKIYGFKCILDSLKEAQLRGHLRERMLNTRTFCSETMFWRQEMGSSLCVC